MVLIKFIKNYSAQCFMVAVTIFAAILWSSFLGVIKWPIQGMYHVLQHQQEDLHVLKSLPPKWQDQIKLKGASELMSALHKNWTMFLPQNPNVQFQQLNKIQVRSKAQGVDEQAFIQWLWTMQQQYAFQIEQLSITPTAQVTKIDVDYVLQVI
jgi:hypothetical protein